ncbi:MAG: hypothetical protein ABSA59_17780 [Terriglobia bacterium]|jgi:hypothetical protein
MKKKVKRQNRKSDRDTMRPEYDFSQGIRGKYASRFPKDTIAVVLDPDVAEIFPDAKSVNDALRALGHIIRDRPPKTGQRRSSG